jgi:hypothetical protein
MTMTQDELIEAWGDISRRYGEVITFIPDRCDEGSAKTEDETREAVSRVLARRDVAVQRISSLKEKMEGIVRLMGEARDIADLCEDGASWPLQGGAKYGRSGYEHLWGELVFRECYDCWVAECDVYDGIPNIIERLDTWLAMVREEQELCKRFLDSHPEKPDN